MYSLSFADKAKRQFLKLEKPIQERISNSLERAKIRPEAFFEKLVGEDAYRLRVGDYRVIAQIEHKVLIILVIKVGHRRNIYNF